MRFATLGEALFGGLACLCVCVCGVPCRKGHHLFMRFATLGEAWCGGLVFVCVCL